MINQKLKIFLVQHRNLYKIILTLRSLDLSKIIPQNKQRLETDANVFWNRHKAGDFQYEKALSHHCGARLWDKKKFLNYGKKHFKIYLQALSFKNLSSSKQATNTANKAKLNIDIVDWGPGGELIF